MNVLVNLESVHIPTKYHIFCQKSPTISVIQQVSRKRIFSHYMGGRNGSRGLKLKVSELFSQKKEKKVWVWAMCKLFSCR